MAGDVTTSSAQAPDTLQALMHHLQEWRWPEALSALQSDVLLVTDADIADAIISAYGPLRCGVAAPDAYSESVHASVKKIIFFCRTGERAHVRNAKEQYPALQIYSATYDLGRVSIASGGYFEWNLEAAQKTTEDRGEPVLILTTPGSDADYLATLMKQNGLGDCREYLNRTAASWAQEQSDFSVLRFLFEVSKKHGGDRLQFIMYTDVLQQLLAHTNISMERFIWLLEKNQTRVIYFSRRDKSMQVALLAQLKGELGRSFWAQGHLAQQYVTDVSPVDAELDDSLADLLRAESVVEPKLAKLKKFKFLTLEETVESPVEVLEAVAGYLGAEIGDDPKLAGYGRPYKKRPNMLMAADAFRQILMDRLNITVDEHGSFRSKTDFWGVRKA